MEYIVEGDKFNLHYQDLKDKHVELCALNNTDFMKRLPEALHLACIVCYLKETPSYVCLSDKGIVHELAHLIHIPKGNTTTLNEIRALFETTLKLN